MTRKNSGFAADLAAGIDLSEEQAPQRRTGIASNVLTGRSNRLADLASGAVINRMQELVDPARCRMWEGHNRDYQLLTEERCADLIDSIKAQGRQEMPAIVRRVSGEPDYDFDELSIEGLFLHVVALWSVLGAIDHDDRLTSLGWWGLPEAMQRAWAD